MDDKYELAVAELVKNAMASLPNMPNANKLLINQGGVQGEYLINSTFSFPNATSEQIAACLQGMMNVPCCTNNELLELSRQYYHLFVLEKDFCNKGEFSVSRKVALMHTDKNLRQKFCRISTDANRELLEMPAILAMKNMEQGRTADGHTFRVAKIDKITCQGETYCIEFRTDGKDRKQQLLNEHCKEMGLKSASHRTQLDEIHWAIIEGNLLGLLAELGI